MTRTLSFIVTDTVAIGINERWAFLGLYFFRFFRHCGHIGHQPEGNSECQSEIQFLSHGVTSIFVMRHMLEGVVALPAFFNLSSNCRL